MMVLMKVVTMVAKKASRRVALMAERKVAKTAATRGVYSAALLVVEMGNYLAASTVAGRACKKVAMMEFH